MSSPPGRPPGPPFYPPYPPGRPPARRGRGVFVGFFIAGGVFFVLTVIVLLLVAIAVRNAETDGDRQAAGFFLTAAVIPCGFSMLFLVIGLIVALAAGGNRRN